MNLASPGLVTDVRWLLTAMSGTPERSAICWTVLSWASWCCCVIRTWAADSVSRPLLVRLRAQCVVGVGEDGEHAGVGDGPNC